MIRKLYPYTRGYRALICFGILCSAAEAVLEMLLPRVMALVVDQGIPSGNTDYILKMGGLMVVMSVASMALGVGAAFLAAIAGQGFGANLRQAQYDQIQAFSFRNI